jgi:hypothetical protein
MRIRNRTLYTKLRKFVVAAVELLQKLQRGEELPKRPVSRYEFKRSGAVEMWEEAEIDFFLLVFKYSKEIDTLAEFTDCAKYIMSNGAIRKKLGAFDKNGHPAIEIPLTLLNFRMLYSFLGTSIKRLGELSFTDESFDQLYEEFEHYLYLSKMPYKVTAPIQGLSGDIGEVEFDKHLRLRRISGSEKAVYVEITVSPTTIPVWFSSFDIQHSQYMLEADYFQKGNVMNTSSCTEKFDDVITVLRLLKSGKVGLCVTKTESTIWTPSLGRSYGQRFSHRGITVPSSFVLNQTEKSALLRLWKRTRDFKNQTGRSKNGEYINIALRRFNFGVEEDNAENKIIDFLIAFEALYLEGMDELGYRLSTRAAVLLGENDAEAAKVKEVIVEAYGLRSKIVHGKKVPQIKLQGEIIELGDFVRRAEEYLRKSLRLFIALSKTHQTQQKILETIDRDLIDAKSRTSLRRVAMRA